MSIIFQFQAAVMQCGGNVGNRENTILEQYMLGNYHYIISRSRQITPPMLYVTRNIVSFLLFLRLVYCITIHTVNWWWCIWITMGNQRCKVIEYGEITIIEPAKFKLIQSDFLYSSHFMSVLCLSDISTRVVFYSLLILPLWPLY